VYAQFHERFGIDVGGKEAQRRFVNRAYNAIFNHLPNLMGAPQFYDYTRKLADALGEIFSSDKPIEKYVKSDFYRALQAIEILWDSTWSDWQTRSLLVNGLNKLRDSSEPGLGVEWDFVSGNFQRSAVPILDKRLVEEPLDWLKGKTRESVWKPYEKALRHLIASENHPERLLDVITDAYEALEAAAKISTQRDADLSRNLELFVSKIPASDEYRKLLRAYVEYGCLFRHAASDQRPKPKVSFAEAESFVFLTGIFLRLAMK
jgi:hypothetical protein